MNQEKRKIFEEHLKEKERVREQQLQKKKQTTEHKNNPQEDMLFIQKEFRNLNQEMDRLIAEYKKGSVTAGTLTEHHTVMKNYYLEINYVLTSYDRQFYKQLLEKLNQNIMELKKKAEPKRKFKFSRRGQDFGVKETVNLIQEVSTERKQTTIPGIQNKKSQKLTILNQCPNESSFKITNCQNIEVDLLQKTQILFLKNLKNCTIRAAVTKSAVFVDHCENCHFQLSSHQLRIHNTFKSEFSIFVTSKPIIQDCNQVVFNPYTYVYADRARHEQEEQKTNKINLWREVQDFNWLKQNEKSPYFRLEQ